MTQLDCYWSVLVCLEINVAYTCAIALVFFLGETSQTAGYKDI